MTNNLFYEMTINPETDNIFIRLKDPKYHNILAKVGHLEYTKDNEMEFDMEVPQGFEYAYDDEEFTNLIQNAVYDIVATSVQKCWQEAEMVVLKGVEQRVAKLFEQYKLNLDKPYLEMFAEKGYMIVEDLENDNRLTAVNLQDKKTYYFDDENDFAFLKTVLGGSSLIV